MLDGIVSPEAATLYLRMLLDGDQSPHVDRLLPAHRPIHGDQPADGESSARLAELQRLGLVRAVDEPARGLAAVDPSEAFSRLLAGIDGQTAASHEEFGRLLRMLDGLRLDDRRDTRAGRPGPDVEVLTDAGTISRLVRRSRIAARTAYLAVVAAGPGGEPPLGWPDDVETGADAAPVRVLYAAVCPRPRYTDQPSSPVTARPACRPPDVRYGPAAPFDLRVVDHHMAVLALARDPDDAGCAAGAAAVVVRSVPIVGLLRSYFLLLWKQATAAVTDPMGGHLTPFDRRVVGLLAAGHRDADVARFTGTSVRTVRRRIALIAQEFGATSRFVAGVEAYRRGMVSSDPGGGREEHPGAAHERDHGAVGANLPPRAAGPNTDLEPATPDPRPATIRDLA